MWGGAREFPEIHHFVSKISLFRNISTRLETCFLERSRIVDVVLKKFIKKYSLSSEISLVNVGDILEISEIILQIFMILRGK